MSAPLAAPPALCLPALDPAPLEAVHAHLGRVLEQALLPLLVYCDRLEGEAALTDGQFQHVQRIRAVFEALADYDEQTTALLTHHARNTAGLNAQLLRAYERPGPTPAPAVDWQAITFRLYDRFPIVAPDLPLVARIRQGAAYQSGLARLAWPLAQRQAAARLTSHHLDAPHLTPPLPTDG